MPMPPRPMIAMEAVPKDKVVTKYKVIRTSDKYNFELDLSKYKSEGYELYSAVPVVISNTIWYTALMSKEYYV